MSGIATAVIASAVIAGGTTYLASEKASKASESAAQAASSAQKEGMETQWRMFQQTREDYAPWREAGGEALTDLKGLIKQGPGMFDPTKEPGYEFGFKNFIEKPYLSAQSATGKRLSGQTLKGLTQYATDYGTTKYDNFLNRYYQKLAPLQSLSGLGMSATTSLGGLSQNYANSISNLQQNIGATNAQNYINQGNIQSQAMMGYGNIAQNMLNNLLFAKMGVK